MQPSTDFGPVYESTFLLVLPNPIRFSTSGDPRQLTTRGILR